MSEFQEFPKMGRLTRDCVITEKIDGTNAQIHIVPAPEVSTTETRAYIDRFAVAVRGDGMTMFAGSRSRYVTVASDNFGFAAWVARNSDSLWELGEGRHYGEWWGSGVQRGYGLTNGEKRFSLFNVARWADERDREKFPADRPECCGVVPVLYRGLFSPNVAENMIAKLAHEGSLAAPGFMTPEGIVIYHTAVGTMFKKTIERDEEPKSKKRDEPAPPAGAVVTPVPLTTTV